MAWTVAANPTFLAARSRTGYSDLRNAWRQSCQNRVILKTGPTRVPAEPDRDAMFKGHFANIERLAKEGKLVVAGPFGGKSDWRGMFVFAVGTVEEAQKLTETDPVLQSGEMVADYHPLYATAALMAIKGIHERIAPK